MIERTLSKGGVAYVAYCDTPGCKSETEELPVSGFISTQIEGEKKGGHNAKVVLIWRMQKAGWIPEIPNDFNGKWYCEKCGKEI